VKSSRKAIIISVIIGLGLFGYSQYASASKIGAIITSSELLEENENDSKYSIELEFDNPSLLVLTAGETDFFIIANDKKMGDGTLQPFTLPPLSKTNAKGVFTEDYKAEKGSVIKITGTTKYQVLFTSIDVPFVYYPTEEQARNFIHQN
jgi:hypothetical protein